MKAQVMKIFTSRIKLQSILVHFGKGRELLCTRLFQKWTRFLKIRLDFLKFG